MPPIKDSHNSDTVSNKQRSLSAIQAPVDPPQRHINPRAAEGILVSIKHPLAKHQVSGMLFWLEEAREDDCWFLFFSFFLPFFFKGENVPGGTLLTVRVKELHSRKQKQDPRKITTLLIIIAELDDL